MYCCARPVRNRTQTCSCHPALVLCRLLDGSVTLLQQYLHSSTSTTSTCSDKPALLSVVNSNQPASKEDTSLHLDAKHASQRHDSLSCVCSTDSTCTEQLQPSNTDTDHGQHLQNNKACRQRSTTCAVDTWQCQDLSYDSFVSLYMAANQPVNIKVGNTCS